MTNNSKYYNSFNLFIIWLITIFLQQPCRAADDINSVVGTIESGRIFCLSPNWAQIEIGGSTYYESSELANGRIQVSIDDRNNIMSIRWASDYDIHTGTLFQRRLPGKIFERALSKESLSWLKRQLDYLGRRPNKDYLSSQAALDYKVTLIFSHETSHLEGMLKFNTN